MVYLILLRYLLLTEQSVCALYSRFMVRVTSYELRVTSYGLRVDDNGFNVNIDCPASSG